MPEHWDVLPNRAIFEHVDERNRPGEQMLSVTITKGVIRQQTLLASSQKKDSSRTDKAVYKLVQPGDLAYNKMRAWQGAIGVSDYRGIVSPAYVVVRPRRGNSSRYFHYLLRTPTFAKEAERWSFGITSDMWSLRPEHFKMIYGSSPPLLEQAAIARFLDHADRRVQRYIHAEEKLIVLLEEQKQAVIHQAVTGKIDVRTGQPYPSYKPSGVEWLGDVPEHWDVRRLGQIGTFSKGGGGSKEDEQGSGIPCIRYGDLYTTHQYFIQESRSFVSEERSAAYTPIEFGDVLFAGSGETIDEIGKSAVNLLRSKACCGGDVILFRPHRKIEAEYLGYATDCRSAVTQKAVMGRGFTVVHIYITQLKRMGLVLPPLTEQAAIVRFLDKANASVDRRVATARRQIALLREYRTRLIADVVTGKLDVREAAVRLPEVDPLAADDTLNRGNPTEDGLEPEGGIALAEGGGHEDSNAREE